MDKSKLKKLLAELEADLHPEKVLLSKTAETNDQLSLTNTKLAEMVDLLRQNQQPDLLSLLTQVIGKITMVKGEKGDTPEKGVDYFTEEELQQIKDELSERVTPILGKDYFTDEDIKQIVATVTPKKGVDYFDGKDGKIGPRGKVGEPGPVGPKGDKGDPGKDAKLPEVEDIVTLALEEIKKKKLDISDIRNYQQLLPKKGSGYKLNDQRWHGGGSAILLQTDGVDNGSQAILNLIEGTNITLTDNGVGGVTIDATSSPQVATITFIIDGGGSTITTGIKGDLEIPFAGTITQATLLADQTGDIVVDIWKDTYANYPATDADSITSLTPPTISNGIKSQDSTLTNWDTAIVAGDTLRFNVDSATDITRVTLSLTITKS